jgi:hypothetical protein
MSSHHKNKGSPGGSNHYQSQPRLLHRSLNRPTADQAIEHTVCPRRHNKTQTKNAQTISMSQEEQAKSSTAESTKKQTILKPMFGSVIVVVFQIIFRAEIHANNIFLFFKNHF